MTTAADPSRLPFAFGGPALRARVRASLEDFEVEEDLGFLPSGAGEHLFLWVEKRGANTEWAAGQLARAAGVTRLAVGYAGLKDRYAVSRQWFSLHLPGREGPDFSQLSIEGVRVLAVHRHARKLPRGALAGNRFWLRLREIDGDRAATETLLRRIATEGMPNAFGAQRFGRGGGNLDRVRAWFAGQRVGRAERSLLLSAARSALFNQVLAARIGAGTWNRMLDGDVLQLDGRGSNFGPESLDPALESRIARLELHPTGPLWGAGEPRTRSAARALEQAIALRDSSLVAGLAAARVDHDRRSLRVRVSELKHAFEGPDLMLSFRLPAGAYATALLHELVAGDPVQ